MRKTIIHERYVLLLGMSPQINLTTPLVLVLLPSMNNHIIHRREGLTSVVQQM